MDRLLKLSRLRSDFPAKIVDPNYWRSRLLRLIDPPNYHQTSTTTWYDRYPETFAKCRDLLAGIAKPHLLSFGCGAGAEVATLRAYFPDAVIAGVDINPFCLSRSRANNAGGDIHFGPSISAVSPNVGAFDAVFCMAVLQRTPHKVERMRIDDLSSIYPFERFDRQLLELEGALKPGGLLILRHCQYYLSESSIAPRFKAIPFSENKQDFEQRYHRDGRPAASGQFEGSIFAKL